MSDKLTCVRVLREAQSNQVVLGIPREHQDALGWEAGDKVLVTCDADAGTLTLKVVQDD
jgi:bifunctional DNA-binding transcriptional regulator/antitoxin component of YhaV-PrlF toxin-antitoxin module